jgi:hypothetical protein
MEASLGTRPVAFLRTVLVIAVAESFVHYLDNTLRFSDYTGNDPPAVTSWISRWMIPVSWVLFTAAAVVGYRRFCQGHLSEAAVYLGVYSLSGLISIGHYFGVSIHDLSVFQNVFVFLDIALGVVLLCFAIWTARQSGARGRAAAA